VTEIFLPEACIYGCSCNTRRFALHVVELELLHRRSLDRLTIRRLDATKELGALADERYAPSAQRRLLGRSFHACQL
jgi:hypothetical protein